MALSVDHVNAISHDHFGDKHLENVYIEGGSAILQMLKKKNRVKAGGPESQWPVNVASLDTTRSGNPDAQVPLAGRNTMSAVKGQWGHYTSSHRILRSEQIYASNNERIIDIVAQKNKELREDLATVLSNDLYADSWNAADEKLYPFSQIIGDQDFGGIPVADAPKWKSTVGTGKAAFTFFGRTDTALTYYLARAKDGSQKVTHIMVGPDTYNELESIWLDKGLQINIPRGSMENELSLRNFQWRGVKIVEDIFLRDDMTDQEGKFFGIDMDSLLCYYNPGDVDEGEWEKTTIAGFPNAMVRVSTYSAQVIPLKRRTMFRFELTDGATYAWK